MLRSALIVGCFNGSKKSNIIINRTQKLYNKINSDKRKKKMKSNKINPVNFVARAKD